VAGGEQMLRQLAAHVAEADKSESHGSVPALTENVNLTLFAWDRVRRFGAWGRITMPGIGRALSV